jgi:hypothetical protein
VDLIFRDPKVSWTFLYHSAFKTRSNLIVELQLKHFFLGYSASIDKVSEEISVLYGNDLFTQKKVSGNTFGVNK